MRPWVQSVLFFKIGWDICTLIERSSAWNEDGTDSGLKLVLERVDGAVRLSAPIWFLAAAINYD